MRLRILLLGDDPIALVADAQMLRERGMMVFTAFNLENINELIEEVRPDLVFFDAHKSSNALTDAYNTLVNGITSTNIPVIFTLSEDDVYLVTRKRTDSKEKRTLIADNIIGAIKAALRSTTHHHGHKKTKKTTKPDTDINHGPISQNPGAQLSIPFYS